MMFMDLRSKAILWSWKCGKTNMIECLGDMIKKLRLSQSKENEWKDWNKKLRRWKIKSMISRNQVSLKNHPNLPVNQLKANKIQSKNKKKNQNLIQRNKLKRWCMRKSLRNESMRSYSSLSNENRGQVWKKLNRSKKNLKNFKNDSESSIKRTEFQASNQKKSKESFVIIT